MLLEIDIPVKQFLLALVCSIAPIDIAFDAFLTILVMVPVDARFLEGINPTILFSQPCAAPHI